MATTIVRGADGRIHIRDTRHREGDTGHEQRGLPGKYRPKVALIRDEYKIAEPNAHQVMVNDIGQCVNDSHDLLADLEAYFTSAS